MSIRSLCDKLARVERATASQTDAGGAARTWTAIARDVRCRVQPASADLLVESMQAGMRITHRVYLFAEVDAAVGDRIVVDGRTLLVRGLIDADLRNRMRVVLAEEMG